MSTTQWIQVISQVLAIAAALGLGGKWMSGHLKQIKAALPTAVKDAAAVAGDIAKLPAVGAVKAVMGTELHNAEDWARKNQILVAVGTALHSWESNLANLSSNQKGTVVQVAQAELKKVGVTAAIPELAAAVSEFQSKSNAIANGKPNQNTVALDSSIKELQQAADTPAAPTAAAG